MTLHTSLNTFLNHPAVQALGWALLHFVWQGAVLATLFFVANTLTRRSEAGLRYAIGCVVMLLMPIVFVATVLRSEQSPASPSPTQHSVAQRLDGSSIDRTIVTVPMGNPGLPSVNSKPPMTHLTSLTGWIVCLWLAGVIALSMYTAVGWLRVQRLRRRGLEPVHPVWIETMEGLIGRLRVSLPVRLYISAMAEVPTVIGWLRPYILLPVSAVTGLSEVQLRAVLAHELAHIRRCDYLVNLLQNAIETLLFYHPAVWWVSERIRQERENCCDDLAVEVCEDVMLYANALAQLEELRDGVTGPALAATGGDLIARIRRLVCPEDEKGQTESRGSVGAVMAVALVIGALIGSSAIPPIHAQSPKTRAAQAPDARAAQVEVAQLQPEQVQPARVPASAPMLPALPEFEVASIRPAEMLAPTGAAVGRGGVPAEGSGRCGARRLTIDGSLVSFRCVDLRGLIEFAFGVNHPSLLTGPAWLMGQRFDVEAKLPQGASKDQVAAMFQSLLRSRFRLTIRRAVQEQPVNALVVDKGGPKLQEALASDPVTDFNAPPCPPQSISCSATIRNYQGEQVAVTPLSPGVQSYSGPGIGTAVMARPPGDPETRIDAPSMTLAGLAFLLQSTSFQPVVNMTGLQGRFDIVLEWSVDRRALVNQALAESPAAKAAMAGGPIVGSNPDVDAAFEKANSDVDAATQKALQSALQGLGLRLEQRKGPVEVLVVDHVEKMPTEN